MQKSGGIIALVAGIFAVFAAGVTLMVGGLATAFKSDSGSLVVALGWGGLFFSFLTIVMGAVCISAKSKTPGTILIFSSILGAVLGGTFVAIFMVLALIGGILATVNTSALQSSKEIKANDLPEKFAPSSSANSEAPPQVETFPSVNTDNPCSRCDTREKEDVILKKLKATSALCPKCSRLIRQ